MAQSNSEISAISNNLLQTHRAALAALAACRRRYVFLTTRHGIVAPTDGPAVISEYATQAGRLSASSWAGSIVASAVFGLLNVFSVNGQPIVVFGCSIVAAVLFGYLGSGVVARYAKVNPEDPQSTERADRVAILGGSLALARPPFLVTPIRWNVRTSPLN